MGIGRVEHHMAVASTQPLAAAEFLELVVPLLAPMVVARLWL